VIGNLIIAAALLGLAITLADALLSEEQKRWVDLKFTRLWSSLDDLKRSRFTDRLRNWRVQIGIILLSTFISFYILGGHRYFTTGLNSISVGLPFNLVMIILLRWILRADAGSKLLLRLIVVTILYIITAFIFLLYTWETEIGPNDGGFVVAVITLFVVYLAITPLIAVLIGPFVLIAIARLLLLVSELAVRKISEYSKGPVVACSAVLAAIGTLIKAL